MPPKKKGGRPNPKKKGKQQIATTQGAKGISNSSTQNTGTGIEYSLKEPLLPKDFTSNATPTDLEVGSYYQHYKQATKAFRTGLSSLVPSSFHLKSVNDLAKACTFILDSSLECDELFSKWLKSPEYLYDRMNDTKEMDEVDYLWTKLDALSYQEKEEIIEKFNYILVPRSLLETLNTTIEGRTLFENIYGADSSDKGHKHMLEVLLYCKRALAASREKTKVFKHLVKEIQWRKNNRVGVQDYALVVTDVDTSDGDNYEATKEEEKIEMDRFANRFAAFASIYDDEEEGDDDDAGRENEVETIIQERKNGIDSAPISEETDIFTIEEDLIKGSDRLQACSFLHTMEYLLEVVAGHYVMLKNDATATKSSDLNQLMQCAMVANTCMYSVQRAEANLIIDYPYLSSIYHVLAVVFLPSAFFEQVLLSSAPDNVRAKCDKATMIKFLGDIVECCFHNKGNEPRVEELKRKFAKKTGLMQQQVDQLTMYVQTMTNIEIQSSMEANIDQNRSMSRIFQEECGLDMKSHQWLQQHQYIGGKRSILNTIRWLQTILHISDNQTKLISIPGFFGTLWNEKENLADSIQGDLDELLCGSILPELLEWCKTRRAQTKRTTDGYVASHVLDLISPYTSQTIPIISMLRNHMKSNQNAPVPAHLAFGIHCILTSIIELQGGDDVARHAIHAEKSWNRLFQQLKQNTREESETPNHFSFFLNIGRFGKLDILPTPIGDQSTAISARMAFFNPLMAGSYLLFANYVIGMGLGTATVDSIGQLRFVMHLYNALQKTGMLGDLPLLKEADIVFKDTKALWILKDKPTQGEFSKRFLMTWGYSAQAASNFVKDLETGKPKKKLRPQNLCRYVSSLFVILRC